MASDRQATAGGPVDAVLSGALLQSVTTADPGQLPSMLVALAAVQTRVALLLVPPTTTTTCSIVTSTTAPKFLTAREAAERLGLSMDWLYRNAAKLPFTRRVGRRALRFDPIALDRWMANRSR